MSWIYLRRSGESYTHSRLFERSSPNVEGEDYPAEEPTNQVRRDY